MGVRRSRSSAVVHHRRRDPGDDVGAERLLALRIERTAARLAGLEVEQRRHHGRGPEVERDRVARCRRVAGLDVDQEVVRDDGGDLPVVRRSVRRARARSSSAPAARRRPSRRAAARGRTSGPRASPRRARRSASAPPAAGSRAARRRPSAAFGPGLQRRHLDRRGPPGRWRGTRAASRSSAPRSRTRAGRPRDRRVPRRSTLPCTSCRCRARRRSSRSRRRSSSRRRRSSCRRGRAPP